MDGPSRFWPSRFWLARLGTARPVLVLVIATRRLAVARLDADVSGHRLLPDAVALTFGESTAGTVRSKRDAAAFALVLARLSQRLSRAARAPITA